MPRRPQIPSNCDNCNRLSDHLTRGRCMACYWYFLKHKRERPAYLWNGVTGPAVWLETGEPLCDCGAAAVAWVSVPVSVGRVTLPLCEVCAEEERRLTPVSSWSAG